jgi:hypothetical protein
LLPLYKPVSPLFLHTNQPPYQNTQSFPAEQSSLQLYNVENIILLGVIPSPLTPKALDSFFIPFIEECKLLAHGVHTYDAQVCKCFDLHVYPIMAFGDIPAMSKLLCLKGHNGYCPCHTCLIRGEHNVTIGATNYYIPLHSSVQPGQPHDNGWDPYALPIHTEDSLQQYLAEIWAGDMAGLHKMLATHYGVNRDSLLLRIPLLSFELSFPYDFMHLMFENICLLLINHWTSTGKFKDRPLANLDYRIAPHIWDQIGCEMVEAYKTIPSSFVGALPDISKSKYKAEYWSFWMLHIGPTLLHGRFPDDKFYKHYCKLFTIIGMCLQFTITSVKLDELQERIVWWVEKYEKYVLFQ